MSIDSILALIDAEIARLKQVRSLLANTGEVAVKVTERKTKKKSAKVKKAKKTRVLSPEARKRIADAQRKRGAAQKAKTKSYPEIQGMKLAASHRDGRLIIGPPAPQSRKSSSPVQTSLTCVAR